MSDKDNQKIPLVSNLKDILEKAERIIENGEGRIKERIKILFGSDSTAYNISEIANLVEEFYTKDKG